MHRQLLYKLMAYKLVVFLSFTEQTWNILKTTVVVTFNIYNPLNLFVHKKRNLFNVDIFGNSGGGYGLLLWAPLK